MESESTASLGIVDARKELGRLVQTAALRHKPALISNGEAVGILIGAEDVEVLASGLGFNPEIYRDDNGISIWLPELEIYGHGDSIDAAVADLVDETREYVDEYLADLDRYRHSPNRAAHFGYVIKALALDATGRLERSLMGAAPATS